MERLSIIGNLTADPELRTTTSGLSVCSFSVAVNRRPTREQREAGENPPAKFFRVSAWRELGENCAKYLAKGRKVFVAGTISANAYISQQDGKARASLEVNATEVEFLSAAGSGDSAPADQPTQQAAPAASAPVEKGGFTQVKLDDDELPF